MNRKLMAENQMLREQQQRLLLQQKQMNSGQRQMPVTSSWGSSDDESQLEGRYSFPSSSVGSSTSPATAAAFDYRSSNNHYFSHRATAFPNDSSSLSPRSSLSNDVFTNSTVANPSLFHEGDLLTSATTTPNIFEKTPFDYLLSTTTAYDELKKKDEDNYFSFASTAVMKGFLESTFDQPPLQFTLN